MFEKRLLIHLIPSQFGNKHSSDHEYLDSFRYDQQIVSHSSPRIPHFGQQIPKLQKYNDSNRDLLNTLQALLELTKHFYLGSGLWQHSRLVVAHLPHWRHGDHPSQVRWIDLHHYF